MIVREVDWDDAGAVALRAAQRVEIAERYGTDDSEPGPAPTADDITAFYVAYSDDGTPVGCGGLRRIDESHGEIKRMFVAPSARGSGVSTAVLNRLERFGLESGWSRLVLETGTAQPDAIRFYTREGFTPIDRYGYYADSDDSLCFEKTLVASDPATDTLCESCE
ncbi:GNAT family N-acetyltransferase [Conyzicola nivalis]|uniref:N-acetyltransferase n=1 Tax=Conyzicola nivalis TaxID=1477021 RepID=A0A916SP47_9MICO|nr:GNAT family N-acetyltransferase [Conyzicola nivalis]GGB09664.1 N-acetyltransferase [Conyzicola nivalis]